MAKYLGGAAIATLVLALLSLFSPRTAAQAEGLPATPRVGDLLFVEGHSRSSCTVTSVHANWVTCDGGFMRNLVTGAAYTIQQRAK
jgi:hypothetical protein